MHNYHYIYKITRDDGKYYIGIHSTRNLEDGYLGSGKLITRSIKKHGVERHKKEILEFLPSRATLKERERQLVNEDTVADPKCLNIQLGGIGGFSSKEHQLKAQASGCRKGGAASKLKQKGWFDPKAKAKRVATKKRKFEEGLLVGSFTGQKHTNESKQKIAAAGRLRVGDKNNQFGTCWITKGDDKPIKIPKDKLSEYLLLGYHKGRK